MLHGQACAEFEERLTRPIDEFIQDGSPRRVSDGAIHVHKTSLTQVFACMSGLLLLLACTDLAAWRLGGVTAGRAVPGRRRRSHRLPSGRLPAGVSRTRKPGLVPSAGAASRSVQDSQATARVTIPRRLRTCNPVHAAGTSAVTHRHLEGDLERVQIHDRDTVRGSQPQIGT